MDYLKWVLIGLFSAGALPIWSLLGSGGFSLLPVALLGTLFWGAFLFLFWRV